MPSLPNPSIKPKARRGGRPPSPPKAGRDKAVVCQVIVDRVARGQQACGEVLPNRNEAKAHLSRQHGRSGSAKAEELSRMSKACALQAGDGVPSGQRDHAWKLMAEPQSYFMWCLACGAVEESTAEESQRWVDEMDAEEADVEAMVGPCAMGKCRCHWAVPREDEFRIPLDADVMSALEVCSDPDSVEDLCEGQRWTARQLLLDEARNRRLPVPDAQAIVVDFEAYSETGELAPGPSPVADDWTTEDEVHRLLKSIAGFGFLRVQGAEKAEPTIQAIALKLAMANGWELPECERKVWIQVDAAEFEVQDEADPRTP